jgi:dethiobiotin synthetase/adenosylmethionine--8-amino-7-oxononanoate aminotransferase
VRAPPERHGTVEEDAVRLGKWYSEVERTGAGEGDNGGGVADAAKWLEQEHIERIQGLDGMASRTMESVWWPFTQHGLVRHLLSLQSRQPREDLTSGEQEGGCHGRRLRFRG